MNDLTPEQIELIERDVRELARLAPKAPRAGCADNADRTPPGSWNSPPVADTYNPDTPVAKAAVERHLMAMKAALAVINGVRR